MIFQIVLSCGTDLLVEGESIKDVGSTITKGSILKQFWYDRATGERWEEEFLIFDDVRFIREYTVDPVKV